MLRLLVVFIHVCAAMGIFGAMAIEGAVHLELRGSGDSFSSHPASLVARRLGSLSFVLLLLSGIYLTQTAWGWEAAWIRVAMATLIAVMLIGALAPRAKSFMLRAAILIGIVFLMTVKPPLSESLIAIAAAAGAGFLVSLPSRRSRAMRAA